MTTISFTKGQGTGNDFVLFADPDGEIDLSPSQLAAISDRHFGIGADGVMRAVRSRSIPEGAAALAEDDAAEWFMDYHNADGSVAEMCGNGIRVFARHLVERGYADGAEIPIGTRDGVKRVWLTDGDLVTVDMGIPRDTALLPDDGVFVSMGNPHVVLFTSDLATAPVDTVGPAMEGAWEGGTNVEFVRVVDETAIGMRVWERGVGETMSCGTGACASAVAAHLRGYAGRAVEVTLPGGSLHVDWTDEGTVLMTGPAVLVSEGVLRPDWQRLSGFDLPV